MKTSEGPALLDAGPKKIHHRHSARSVHTVAQPTDKGDEYARGFLAGWADRAEYARRTGLTFDDGMEFGWHAARRAMSNAIAEIGAPWTAEQIIRQLVQVWDREVPS